VTLPRSDTVLEYVGGFFVCFVPLAAIGVAVFYADKLVRRKRSEGRGFEVKINTSELLLSEVGSALRTKPQPDVGTPPTTSPPQAVQTVSRRDAERREI
jgi:hypothetical protein